MRERLRFSALDKFEPDWQTDTHTDIVTPWAPDRAKKKHSSLFTKLQTFGADQPATYTKKSSFSDNTFYDRHKSNKFLQASFPDPELDKGLLPGARVV